MQVRIRTSAARGPGSLGSMRTSPALRSAFLALALAGCAHGTESGADDKAASPPPVASADSAAALPSEYPSSLPEPNATPIAPGATAASPSSQTPSPAAALADSSTIASPSSSPGPSALVTTSVPPIQTPTSPAAIPTTTPLAAATPNPDLLTFTRGTFVRRWTIGASTFGAEQLVLGGAWGTDGPFSGIPELVFELPAVAQIAQITAEASMPAGSSAQLQFAVATTNDRDFADVGTVALHATSTSVVTGSLQKPMTARWLRVRIDRAPHAKIRISSIAATGSMTIASASFAGRWALAENVSGSSDSVFGTTKGSVPSGGPPTGQDQIATAQRDGQLTAATCSYDRDVWRGPIEGGTAKVDGGTLNAIAGGTMLIGVINGEAILARRITHAPSCDYPSRGKGSPVAIIARYPRMVNSVEDPARIPGHRYSTYLLPTFTSGALSGVKVAVLAMSCAVSKDAAPSQHHALLDFVQRGGVLIIRDADVCPKSEYGFMPYPFTTLASGAGGARGRVLSIVDSSALASTDPSDKGHYVDTGAYLKSQMQQIGDADVMQTEDKHWCGLMFAKNRTGASGWVRAFARYGKGVIVYDGFDVDDLNANIPQAVTLNRLAYGLSANTDLPCNAHVASPLVLLSSVRKVIAFGRPRDFRLAFWVDQEGPEAPEHVALSLGGERGPGWRATIDRSSLKLAGNEQRVTVSIHVPANATASRHLYTLSAKGPYDRSAQAAIEFDVNEALAKELEKGRARIYGIHFDVASARIEPQSEATIREIAAVLRMHAAWNMRIEGYTDSDGGAAYNLGLSDRRAHAVLDDLVAHYGIARRRLKWAGFGLTHPVASNATDAGKALNRRVELARL